MRKAKDIMNGLVSFVLLVVTFIKIKRIHQICALVLSSSVWLVKQRSYMLGLKIKKIKQRNQDTNTLIYTGERELNAPPQKTCERNSNTMMAIRL